MAMRMKDKKEIGMVRLHWSFLLNREGIPIAVFPKGRIPRQEELLGMVFEKISEMGYSAKRVGPQQANCVIRLYSNLCLKIEENNYCVLGAFCYTKAHGANKWVRYEENVPHIELDFSKCVVEAENTEGNHYKKVEADYFDIFVKVSGGEQ